MLPRDNVTNYVNDYDVNNNNLCWRCAVLITIKIDMFRILFFLTGSVAHTASCWVDTAVLSPGGKAPISVAEMKYECLHSPILHADVDRDSFTLYWRVGFVYVGSDKYSQRIVL
jgi:hypothetical protein